MHFSHLFDDGGRGLHVAEPPAGDGVGLGQGVAGDHAVGGAGQGRAVHVLARSVHDVLVGLVGDDEGVVLLRERQDLGQLGTGEDLAAGIRGIADDDRLGALREGAGKLRGIVREVRRPQVDVDGLRAGQDGVGRVILIEGREHDDFVTRIAHGHHRGHHRLGAAAGDHEVAVGIEVEAAEATHLGRQRLPETGRAPGHGILVMRSARGPLQCGEERLGRIEVRESLGEVDGAVPVGEAGHPPDHRLGESGQSSGGPGHEAD